MALGFATIQKVYASQDIEVLRQGYLTASLAGLDNQIAVQKVPDALGAGISSARLEEAVLNLDDSLPKTETLLKPFCSTYNRIILYQQTCCCIAMRTTRRSAAAGCRLVESDRTRRCKGSCHDVKRYRATQRRHANP